VSRQLVFPLLVLGVLVLDVSHQIKHEILFTHFLLPTRLPYCGDSVPKVLIFFRDSQVISALFLIETLAVQSLIKQSDRPHSWISSVVFLVTTNRVGEVLLAPTTSKIEDVGDLVESVRKNAADINVWLAFSKIIDRFLFFVFLILYLVMFVALVPEGYLAATFSPLEVLE
jgi:hypothetical protein